MANQWQSGFLRDDTTGALVVSGGTGGSGSVTIDTDGTLAANSDTVTASQKAIRTYVAANAGGGSSVPTRVASDRYRPGRIFSTRFIPDTGKAATGVAATDIITVTTHGYSVGEVVFFSAINGGAGLTVGVPYFISATNFAASTFSLSLTAGGSVVDFTTDITATSTVKRVSDASLYSLSNFSYVTDAASRPAIRASDGGTATAATLLTVARDIRNGTLRVRYRPATDTTTASTDYGLGVVARKLNEGNKWDLLQAHAESNPNVTFATYCENVAGTTAALSAVAKALTGVAATGIFTSTAHGFLAGDLIRFYNLVGGTGLTPQAQYYVVQANLAANTFSVSATEGGAVLTFSSDVSSGSARNNVALATHAVTGLAATDIFTSTAHGFVAGDRVFFSNLQGGTGITADTAYYVIAANLAANTFQVSTTSGGTALNFTTDLTTGSRVAYVGGISLNQDRVFVLEVIDDLAKWKSFQADQIEPDWQFAHRIRSPQASTGQDNCDIGAWGIGGGGLFMGSYIVEMSLTELVRDEPTNLFRNADFKLKDRQTGTTAKIKDPAYWASATGLLSGNANDIVLAADDNGITRRALHLTIATPNDTAMSWTHWVYSPRQAGYAAIGNRSRRHPMFDTVNDYVELSWLIKWSGLANIATLGLCWDLYYYDALNNPLNLGDPTYFPSALPASPGASGGPTRMTARINILYPERLFSIRAQLLPHDTTMIGDFTVWDPKLTPIA